MTSVVVIDGGGNVLEYVTGDEEAQQVWNLFTSNESERTLASEQQNNLFRLRLYAPFCELELRI